MKPHDLILRCYACQKPDGGWYARCLDLDLEAEAPDLTRVKRSLEHAISGYLETIYDTEDRVSVPHLLSRSAPPSAWLFYYCIKWVNKLCSPFQASGLRRERIAFKEPIPIHLAHHCA